MINITTTMETQTLCDKDKSKLDYSSNVDTSRPFRSVKEAVALFGERLLQHSSPKPAFSNITFTKQEIALPPSPRKKTSTIMFIEGLEKLQAELDETKAELKLLKEKETETEAALASLQAKIHKNMSPTLAQLLTIGDQYFLNGNKNGNMTVMKKNNKKRKPIVPLIGDFISWKKNLFS